MQKHPNVKDKVGNQKNRGSFAILKGMRLLQLNAWTARLHTRIIDMMNEETPDIVALQEMLESKGGLGFFPTLSELSQQLHFDYDFFSPVYGLSFAGRRAEYGNAILSTFPLSNSETVFTNLSYKEDMKSEHDDYNVRNFQYVVVDGGGGKTVHIINHHGYHIPEHKNGDDYTRKACQQILDYTSRLEGPVIITGDFNLHPDSESLNLINNHFRNLTKEFNLETTRTDLTYKTEACDYIFVNNELVVNNFYASSTIASDHQALVLDFETK